MTGEGSEVLANTTAGSGSASVAVDARAVVNDSAAEGGVVLANGGQRGVPARVLARSELPTPAQLAALNWQLEVLVTPGLFGAVRA